MTRSLRYILGLTLACAPALGAQTNGTAVVQSLRTFADQYSPWLVAAFDSIPADKYGYKPTPAQQSVGYIAQHIETSSYALCGLLGGVTHARTARDSVADTIKAMWPKDTLVARLKAAFAFCNDALTRVTDAMLADQVAYPSATKTTTRALFGVGYVSDLADHYSQIANYMRLNGMLPPSARRKAR